LDERVRRFLEVNHAAFMCTLRKDGSPHVARMDCGLVDDKLWSSGTQDRVRTGHVRRDPRATLAVPSKKEPYKWLGLDCRVRILEGPDAVEQNLTLYRALAGEPDDLDEYREAMVKEKRLIYEFEILKAYGTY
jgi:PPOX class probable F420-dependent enzyme